MSDIGSSRLGARRGPSALVRPLGARHALPLAMLAALAMAGCGTPVQDTPKQPAFYDNLAKSGQPVDPEAAASLFSDYRNTKGLNAVSIDPALNKIAQDQANAMAKADTLSHEVGGRTFVQRMNASGYKPKVAVENVGAGYHTLAEAFSG